MFLSPIKVSGQFPTKILFYLFFVCLFVSLFAIINASPNIEWYLGYLFHRYGKDIPKSTQLIVLSGLDRVNRIY